MANGFKTEGFEEVDEVLDILADPLRLDRETLDAFNVAYARGMRKVRNRIPKDTGELQQVLTVDKTPKRQVQAGGSGDEVLIVPTIPQAKYQSRRIPAPDSDEMGDLAASIVIDRLFQEVGES